MMYTKPEIILLGDATNLIRGPKGPAPLEPTTVVPEWPAPGADLDD